MQPRKANDVFSQVCLKVQSIQGSLEDVEGVCNFVSDRSLTDDTESQLLQGEVLRHLRKAQKSLTETIERIELTL